MAARRLLLLMLVLLAVSSLAAALIPPQSQRDESATDTATKRTAGARDRAGAEGRLVRRTVDTRARGPRTLRLRLDDELALTVRSRTPEQVEIPAYGQLEDVGPYEPARFDVLLDRRGAFDVRTLEPGRAIARIVVGPPRKGGERRS